MLFAFRLLGYLSDSFRYVLGFDILWNLLTMSGWSSISGSFLVCYYNMSVLLSSKFLDSDIGLCNSVISYSYSAIVC